MHKRGYCRHAVSVRLSVRLSVTFVSCVKTNKDICDFFLSSGSQAILVFPCRTEWRYSDGNPLTGGGRRMQVRYTQKSRFWSNSWLSKIAGRAKCQKHLPTTKLSIWHSRPRTTGYRSIAGRANYEVAKNCQVLSAGVLFQFTKHHFGSSHRKFFRQN